MNRSSKKKLNIPVSYSKWVSTDGQGDSTYETSATLNCYREDDIKVIVDRFGKEDISSIQLYFDGEDTTVQAMTVNDVFEIDDLERPIKNFKRFFTTQGNLDLVVAML